MGKVLFIILSVLCIRQVNAFEAFFQSGHPQCFIKHFKEGKFEDVSESHFSHRPIEVKVLPKNPSMVAFKENNLIYISPAFCMLEKKKVELPRPEINKKTSVLDDFLHKEYFIELEGGSFTISDQNQVSRDYNETFPSTSTNPTTWSKADKSKYKAGLLISAGVGFRQTQTRSFIIKLKSMTGKKTDTLTLTDINSGLSETGDWIYSDAFLNLYAGYRFQFFPDSRWKPSIGGFVGVSKSTTKLTDNSVTYQLNALGVAVMAELGLEYLLGSAFSLSSSIGLEYLGPRNLKFEDSPDTQGIKTKMSYNNTYLALGIKYYF